VNVAKGDLIYIFTDGYADQFGGEKGKKFKYKSLQQLLLGIHNLSMEEQHRLLDKTIEEWRGALEQVDDILVIGVRI
jgi:serine phosphatase RsbU (regulator of sigma subunit)